MELWKEIEGFDSVYEVSNEGRVRNRDTQKIMIPTKRGRGYWGVNLHKNKKQHQRYIHRLVAEAFIDNPNQFPCVNHIDEDKNNNTVSNLEWCSYSYNNSYGTRLERIKDKLKGRTLSDNERKRLSEAHRGKPHKGKTVLCVETGEIFESAREAARKLEVDRCTISGVCSGKGKTAKGYHWRYL